MPTTSKGLVWTVAEMQTFEESSADHRLTNLYVLLGATGARIGEALALTWDDIDFAESTVFISKAVAMVKGVRNRVIVEAVLAGRSHAAVAEQYGISKVWAVNSWPYQQLNAWKLWQTNRYLRIHVIM
jgi:integrase